MALAVALAFAMPARGADDVEGVHKLLDRVEQAWTNHDLKALDECCAEKMLAIVSRPGNPEGAYVAGKAQLLEQIGKTWAGVVSHQFVERDIIVQQGLAWMRLTVADKAADRSSRLTRVINGAIQEGGAWKVFFSMPQIAEPAVVVTDVLRGAGADGAGVRPGDRVVSVDGRPATGVAGAGGEVAGAKHRVVLRRGAEERAVEVADWPHGVSQEVRLVAVEPAVFYDKDKPHAVKARLAEGFAGLVTGDAGRMGKVLSPQALVPMAAENQGLRLVDKTGLQPELEKQMQLLRETVDLSATSLVDVRVIALEDVAVVSGRMQSVRRDEGKTAVSQPIANEVFVRQGQEWYMATGSSSRLETGLGVQAKGVKVDATAVTNQVSGKMVGIGVGLEALAEGMKIKQVMVGSSAEAGGLKAGEVITAVDGQKMAGLAVTDAVARITGAEGTKVSLVIQAADGQSRTVELERKSFRISSLDGRLTEEGCAVVRITAFSMTTAQEFREKMKELGDKGARGLVLDLRACAGGAVQGVKETAESLLPGRKLLWIVEGDGGKLQRVMSAGREEITMPLVVLVGKNTAGAGELLASALKENGRATVVGQKTQGQAKIREVVKRPDGSSELVDRGRFLAKPDVAITGQGIAPDTELPADLADEAALAEAVKAMKAKLGPAAPAKPSEPAKATSGRKAEVIGTSVEGRPIEAYVFGGEGPGLCILGGMHGDEPAGALICDELIAHLERTKYAGRRLVVVPRVNPDGLERRQRGNARGVDINRNFPVEDWRRNRKGGPWPGSEPESVALYDFIVKEEPVAVVSLHQKLKLIDYDGPAEDLAMRMAKGLGYPVRRMGTPPGSTGAWIGETLNIPLVTVEMPENVERAGAQELWKQCGTALLEALPWADVEAMIRTADAHDQGRGVPQDFDEAVKWYRKAVEAGSTKAMMRLGAHCEGGRGVPRDMKEAFNWYRQAAEGGNALGMTAAGNFYAAGLGVTRDDAAAAKWFSQAAEVNQPYAMARLGDCYANGRGVAQDYGQALAWYRKAAGREVPQAMVGLGNLYANGQGVARDYFEAVQWYRKAADKGHPVGMHNLSWCLETGNGAQPNRRAATTWSRQAAEKEYIPAMVNMGRLTTGDGEGRANYRQAMTWYRKAADAGNGTAMFCLGVLYEAGRGAKADRDEAIRWYEASAKAGYAKAEAALKRIKDNRNAALDDQALLDLAQEASKPQLQPVGM
jgi:C-terminal peptidase prc